MTDAARLHGARGNSSAQHRRACALELPGDDACHVERPEPTSAPFPGHGMRPGNRLHSEGFPVIGQRPA